MENNVGSFNSKTTNCVFIGINAGLEITEGDGLVIFGENVVNLDKSQSGVVFIGDRIAIGKTIFGQPINLGEIISKGLIEGFELARLATLTETIKKQ